MRRGKLLFFVSTLIIIFLAYFVVAIYIYSPNEQTNSCLTISRNNITIYGNNQFATIGFAPSYSGNYSWINYAYYNDTSSSGLTPVLAYRRIVSNRGYIHVLEGEPAQVNDWIVINQGDNGGIIKVDSIDLIQGDLTGTVDLSDALTGASLGPITLINGTEGFKKTGANFLGGTGYVIRGNGTQINITWNSGATAVFPRIKLQNGGWIAFLTETNVSNSTASRYILPDGQTTLATTGITFNNGTTGGTTNASYVISDTLNWSVKGGRTSNTVLISDLINPVCNFNITMGPAVLFMEKANSSGSRNAFCIPLNKITTNPLNLTVDTPSFNDGSSVRSLLQVNSSEAVDSFGTYLKRNSSAQGTNIFYYDVSFSQYKFAFTLQGYVCSEYSGLDSSQNLINFTINNTDQNVTSNITQINVTLLSGLNFISGTNGTTSSATFSNTSTILSWTSTSGVVINLTSQNFWFRVNSSVPGRYELNLTVANSTGFNIENLAITINDTLKPTVDFVNPTLASGTNADRTNIPINLSVNDNGGIDRVTINLFLSDSLINSSSSNNVSSLFANFSSLSYGTYKINATVNDTSGNLNYSETRTITLAAASTDTSSSSGGGGGGGATAESFWTSTFTISNTQFESGFSQSLGIRGRIKFTVNGSEHSVGIINMTETSATINISSTPQQAVFNIGDIKKFELTNDNYYDVKVTLNSIASGKANVSIVKISELIPVVSTPTTPQTTTEKIQEKINEITEQTRGWKFWTVIILIAIVIVVVVYLVMKKMKK